MTVSFDPNALLAAMSARYGIKASPGASAHSAPKAPTAPWSQTSGQTNGTKPAGSSSSQHAKKSTAAPTLANINSLIDQITGRSNLIDPAAAKLSLKSLSSSANADYSALFAVYNLLDQMNQLATVAADKATPDADRARIETAFAKAQSQLTDFLSKHNFNQFKLIDGKAMTSDKANQTQPGETDNYTTRPLLSGSMSDVATKLSGPLAFDLAIKGVAGANKTIKFDLSEMGDTPRTLPNVVSYLNGKLAAAGVATRFSVSRTPDPDAPKSAPADLVSLQIKGASYENLTFSAAGAGPAVYVAQSAGYSVRPASVPSASPSQQQLVKLDANGAVTDTTKDQIFKKVLSGTDVRNIATGPDGPVYVLSNDSGKTADGQGISGKQDMVLTKYDSAGNVVYARSLGAKDTATGYSLAVSADGKQVAVAGNVKGALDPSNPGATKSGTDTVVTVFAADKGTEAWTKRVGSPTGDDHPTGVAFGADGSVYVTGETTSALNGLSGQKATSDNFLIGLSSAGAVKFQTQYGAASGNHANGVVDLGNHVVVAGVENGHAILRSFSKTSPATQLAVRDLGDLKGGDIAGITVNSAGQLIVAGSTHASSLDVAKMDASSDGGRDVFVATLDASLTKSASDHATLIGLGQDATTTTLTLSAGVVYVGGQIAASGASATSAHNGFVAAIDPATGQKVWSQTFSGLDGQDAVIGLAVAPGGASALDKLGLPTGTIDWTKTDKITDFSSVRPGDSFYVNVNGTRTQVKIEATDTLATLAQKINRASGFQLTASSDYSGNGRQLSIKPANSGSSASIEAGPADSNALSGLGLQSGLINTPTTAKPTGAAAKTNIKSTPYALNLSGALDVGTQTGAVSAKAALAAAIQVTKTIYTDLTTPKSAASVAHGSSRPVPAYLSNQLANYKQGLARLSQFSGG